MATKKKMLQAAAGNAGGAALDITDVFSTYLYTGTGSAQTITNGIDLAGEGGLVWIKNRTSATNNDHSLFDSVTFTGSTFPVVQKAWESNVAGSLASRQPGLIFTDTGFTTAGITDGDQSGIDYASWSFRKCPKFFDAINYTGDGTSGRTISHNLGVVPATIIVMGQSTGDYWVYQKDVGNTKYLELNKTTAAQTNSSAWNNTTPTDSVFTVGTGTPVNFSGYQYTAYLFAHNDGDGEFGPSGDQDIIKCGSYTGNGGANTIDLGFEPQWIMVKRANSLGSWMMYDVMRGLSVTANGVAGSRSITANTSASETDGVTFYPTSTGFYVYGTNTNHNASGSEYIYIAIRRGPLAPPESGTEVFAIDTATLASPVYTSGFPVDFAITKQIAQTFDWNSGSRLTQGKLLYPNLTDTEASNSNFTFDFNDGWFINEGTNSNRYSWMWKRAPGFFDVVAYTGSNSDLNVSHNLGAVPEMMWVKCRSGFTENWTCYHKDLGNTKEIKLNTNGVPVTSSVWANTTPTESVFTVDGDNVPVSKANTPYIAYLFASLDGISKVGSYTGNGGTLTVDCGFTSGARFVLFRNITATNGDWTLADTARGIVSGNDSALDINNTSAAITNEDFIDPHSSGFTVVNASGFVDSNTNGHTYLFYAIA